MRFGRNAGHRRQDPLGLLVLSRDKGIYYGSYSLNSSKGGYTGVYTGDYDRGY